MRQTNRTYVRIPQLLGLLALALFLAACGQSEAPGGGGGGDVTVSIDQGATATVAPGRTLQLSATVEGADSDAVDWTSSDATLATVSEDGLVTAAADAPLGESVTVMATSEADPSAQDTIEVTFAESTTDEPGIDPAGVFVDDDAAAGGDGSQGSPFQTIEEGIAAAADGQTVNVLDGTYTPDAFTIDQSLALNGEGAVVIQIDGTTAAEELFGAIEVNGAIDVTLSGFTLQVDAAGTLFAAVAMFGGVSNVDVIAVDVEHDNVLHGFNLVSVENVTLDGVSVIGAGTGSGAGVRVTGSSSGVTLDNVATEGHENYAGVLLLPGADATMSNITINDGAFDEVNMMTVDLSDGGELTDLSAPQFSHVVRNLWPPDGPGIYGGGDWWFYKTSEDIALRDALFNFAADEYFAAEADNLGIDEGDVNPEEGAASIVHTLDPVDQSVLGNEIIVGEYDDGFGYGVTRSSNIQVALDQAFDLGIPTVLVREGTFRGHGGPVTVPAGVDVIGEGETVSVVVADVATDEEVLVGAEENVTDVGLQALGAP